MTRVFIVDPSLKDLRGHHYNLTRAASDSIRLAGLSPVWFCGDTVETALSAQDAKIFPVFRASMYDQYKAHTDAPPSGAMALLRKARAKIFGVAGSQEEFQSARYADKFLKDLISALGAHVATSDDHVLIHTADGATYVAIEKLFSAAGKTDLPTFHVSTPYDPVGVMPNRGRPDAVCQSVSALLSRGVIGKNLFLYAETSDLVDHLTRLWGAPVAALPLPAFTAKPNDGAIDAMRSRFGADRNGALLVTALGAARIEKGFHLFPEIVRAVKSNAGQGEFSDIDPRNIIFALHASPQIIGRAPEISNAIDQLSTDFADMVHILTSPLGDEDYRALLFAADIVCLPYDRESYAVRSSGIVSEAVAAGRVMVATTGSYPGRAAQNAGGIACDTPQEFASGILTIAGDRDRYFEAAAQAKEKYCRANAVSEYWPRCIKNMNVQ